MGTVAAQPLYKAVCYRCKYEGAANAMQCPKCSFPVILETENTPPGEQRLDDILRSDNRPRLPGVRPKTEPAAIEARRDVDPTPVDSQTPSSRRGQSLRVAMVCTAALAAGIIAAVIHQGL